LFSDKHGTLAGFIKTAEEKERSCSFKKHNWLARRNGM
jgi:hypothetical protein